MKSDEIPFLGQVTLGVPGVGTITGLSLNNTTCQYLGIPYASIPGRFRRSVPTTEWEVGHHDGTKLGPYCPQPPRDFYPVPNPARHWLEVPPTDEFKCLNLNVSVPSLPGCSEGLPVMVFLHGGAFTYATANAPVYDGRLLASASADLDKPTIVVTVNYRLGVFGFLAGEDLLHYNASQGETGVGNFGVWDQVLALRWVQKNITAFGGDPKRITLFGQSAGGVSTHAHLLRGEPLFSSAILQSGLLRTCGILSVSEWQILFEKMLKATGVSPEASTSERVEKLAAVPVDQLMSAMQSVFIIPVVTMPLCDDGVLVDGPMPTYDDYTKPFVAPSWCSRLMMGDAKNECIIWNKSWDNLSKTPVVTGQDLSTPETSLVLAKMMKYLGPEKAIKVAELYGISEGMFNEDIFWALERLTTDGIFSLPIYFAELATPSSPTTLYAYHFNVPSPYDNAWGGLGHHSHDNVLLWGVLRHTLPLVQQAVSDTMVKAWIMFANGEAPWPAFSKETPEYMVFDGEGSSLKKKTDETGRSYGTWDALHKEGLVGDGNLYGTSERTFSGQSAEGKIVILDVDMRGIQELKKEQLRQEPGATGVYPPLNPRFVFITPANVDVLEERLRGCGTEDEAAFEGRLARARVETKFAETSSVHDKIIVNDNLHEAVTELAKVVFGPL
ncbi:hypothetical protein SEUCBS139899_005592 [Sporothrix eucalyptigena]|uniref:Carboxylic ester hydrolase n=1 Tax=Sporothrix eucalyptigena TaxID=1812306 RepID=A0ABP0C357_9PEZI